MLSFLLFLFLFQFSVFGRRTRNHNVRKEKYTYLVRPGRVKFCGDVRFKTSLINCNGGGGRDAASTQPMNPSKVGMKNREKNVMPQSLLGSAFLILGELLIYTSGAYSHGHCWLGALIFRQLLSYVSMRLFLILDRLRQKQLEEEVCLPRS